MRKKIVISAVWMLLLLALVFSVGSSGAERSDSKLIELASVSCPSASTAANSIVPHPAGLHNRLKNRGIFVVKTLGSASTDYYNISPAYYQFLFMYSSNPSEGGIANFLDVTGALKASLHLSAANKLLFYDSTSTLRGTGTTVLSSSTVYTISVKVSTGPTSPWEVKINGTTEMSGTNNLGSNTNGSILLGGGSSYTDVYYYDNISICTDSYTSGMINFVDFETGDLSQAATSTNAIIGAGLAGTWSLELARNNSVANYEIRASPVSVYLQNSADDGQTWVDIANVVAYNGTIYVPISTVVAPTIGFFLQSGNVLTPNTCNQGPIGDMLRVRYDARNTKGGFNFQAFIHAN